MSSSKLKWLPLLSVSARYEKNSSIRSFCKISFLKMQSERTQILHSKKLKKLIRVARKSKMLNFFI